MKKQGSRTAGYAPGRNAFCVYPQLSNNALGVYPGRMFLRFPAFLALSSSRRAPRQAEEGGEGRADRPRTPPAAGLRVTPTPGRGVGGAREAGGKGRGLTPAAAASAEPAASSPRRPGSPAALWSARLACLVWRTGRLPGDRRAWGGAARRSSRDAPAPAAAVAAAVPAGPRRQAGWCAGSARRGVPGRRGWGPRRPPSCGCTWR